MSKGGKSLNTYFENMRYYQEAWKYLGTVVALFAIYFVFGAIFVA